MAHLHTNLSKTLYSLIQSNSSIKYSHSRSVFLNRAHFVSHLILPLHYIQIIPFYSEQCSIFSIKAINKNPKKTTTSANPTPSNSFHLKIFKMEMLEYNFLDSIKLLKNIHYSNKSSFMSF
jgi:hypothetical protein